MDFGSDVLEVRYPRHLETGRHPPRSHFHKSTVTLFSIESKIVEKQALHSLDFKFNSKVIDSDL